MVAIEITKDHALAIGVVAFSALVHTIYMTFGVTGARKKYGVKHPTVYATSDELKDPKQRDEFNSVMRAHMNSLEYLPTMLSLMFTAAIEHPRAAGVLGAIYTIARVLYFWGYSTKGPKGRTIGFTVAFLCMIGLVGLTAKSAVGIALS